MQRVLKNTTHNPQHLQFLFLNLIECVCQHLQDLILVGGDEVFFFFRIRGYIAYPPGIIACAKRQGCVGHAQFVGQDQLPSYGKVSTLPWMKIVARQ